MLYFFLFKQLQEQQKQLSLLQEEQLKTRSLPLLHEKPQGQEVEVQTDSQNDEEDAKTFKPLLSKAQSCDTPLTSESSDDKEKSGFSIRRSRTLPGRLKASPLESEDKTGNHIHFAVFRRRAVTPNGGWCIRLQIVMGVAVH